MEWEFDLFQCRNEYEKISVSNIMCHPEWSEGS